MRRGYQSLGLRLRLHARFDPRRPLAAWAIVVSLLSGMAHFAVTDALAAMPSFAGEAEPRSSSRGDIAVEVTYRAAEGDILVFAVVMDAMKMKTPP